MEIPVRTHLSLTVNGRRREDTVLSNVDLS